MAVTDLQVVIDGIASHTYEDVDVDANVQHVRIVTSGSGDLAIAALFAMILDPRIVDADLDFANACYEKSHSVARAARTALRRRSTMGGTGGGPQAPTAQRPTRGGGMRCGRSGKPIGPMRPTGPIGPIGPICRTDVFRPTASRQRRGVFDCVVLNIGFADSRHCDILTTQENSGELRHTAFYRKGRP